MAHVESQRSESHKGVDLASLDETGRSVTQTSPNVYSEEKHEMDTGSPQEKRKRRGSLIIQLTRDISKKDIARDAKNA